MKIVSEKYVDFRVVKQRVSIEQVLGHYGIALRRANQNALRGKCPLPTHSSGKSRESFSVAIDRNIWACQSVSCASAREGKRGGNVIDFVAIMESCSIRDAALKLDDWFLSPSSSPATTGQGSEATQKLVAEKNALGKVGEDFELNRHELTRQFNEKTESPNPPLTFTLKGIDPAHPYLQARGISEEIAEYFGVGFFPGRGSMRGRVVIPISNERGELVAYAGRAIDASEPKYKLPSGFKKSEVLWNLDRVLALQPEDPVIVVEGFFDCMKIHQAGLPKVVALIGSSLSESQAKFLSEFTRIVLCLDGDEPGRQATAAIAPRLTSCTFVRVVHLADGQQPDQLSSDEIKNIFSF